MVKGWVIAVAFLLATLNAGCASVGIECSVDRGTAWAKVRRVGRRITRADIDDVAEFRSRLCVSARGR